MRRQGLQHGNGIVRTYRILPPPLNPRLVNSSTSPPTSSLFTKLPSKPTKGNRNVWSGQVHWLRSNDIASSSYKLLTWPVLTGRGAVLSDGNGNGDNGEAKGGEEAEVDKEEDGGSHDDEESMSFYDVGMMMMEHVLDDDEEDGWCLV
ncbi:hypothetical protein AALP_AA5G042700 [Arabis alpina]|uniref:Uncharacterized protein n=1 Tax=Arabis alpina TaxID=50452 RepID=A0A087GUV8_ARAAL|nr:hypothetical protein AALP_AA5G042700 [Arabis alpina]